jgi:hypothetical protein
VDVSRKRGMNVDVHLKMDLDECMDEILMNIDECGWVSIGKKNIIEDRMNINNVDEHRQIHR